MRTNKKNFRFLGIFLAVLVIVLSIYFTWAYPTATNIIVHGNSTNGFDNDGIFTINWTNDTSLDNDGHIGNWTVNFWYNTWTSAVVFVSSTDAANTSGTNFSWGYAVSNNTNGNYTYNFTAFFTNGTRGAGTSNITVVVDKTAPAHVFYDGYTNKTTQTSSEVITLNISTTDTGIKKANACSLGFLFPNGTLWGGANQTLLANVGTNCNNTQWNLTGLSDGNWTFVVYANDSANNTLTNQSTIFWVEVDSTAPAATATCSPTAINTGDTFPCTCSGSDASSGINKSIQTTSSTSDTVSDTPSTGTFTYSCTVYDNAGNSHTSTATYTVEQTSIASSSTGGSSTGAVSSQDVHSFAEITPSVPITKEYTNPELGVKQIQIEVSSEAQNVQLTVKEYESKPSAVSVAKTGKVERYIQVETQNLADKLKKATMRIQVEKTWASTNNLDKEDIALFKFNQSEEKWNELTTNYVEDDANYYYYDINLTSFSYFAIGAKTSAETGAGEGAGTGAGETGSKTWLWIIIAVIVIAAAVGGIAAKRKK